MNTTSLLGISFYKGTYREFLNVLKQKIESKESALIVTPNPEMLYEARHDTSLRTILQNAHYAVPDGAGLFVAYQASESRLPKFLKYFLLPYWCLQAVIHGSNISTKYGKRITGSRLTRDLLDFANAKNISVTILDPEVFGNTLGDQTKKQSQQLIQETLQKKYPNIHLTVIIGDTVPDILAKNGIVFATHGNGKQEKLLADLMKKNPNSGIAVGIGGSIDLLTGFRQPAPRFFQRFGGEWLYRLYKNPRKHWKRMKKVISFVLFQGM